MVSRENKIIVACILVALPLWAGVTAIRAVPDWVGFAILFGVGVLLPGILTNGDE